MTDSPQRTFDLILWGATGFTGRLVAEYLATHAPKGFRWAIAGRNEAKLLELQQSRCGPHPPDVRTANLQDPESLNHLTAQTKVLVSTVGPYAKWGTPMVRACVETQTDYCDLTGEVPWIRESIDQFHEHAKANGTRIVHCCGFDSIPSDLGTLLLHQKAKEDDLALDRVNLFSNHTKGGLSGGTIASMIGVVDQAQDRNVRRLLRHPYSLNPDSAEKGPDGSEPTSVRFDSDLQKWTAPFLMAAINSRVVRRSNALMDYAYGPSLRYSEATATRKGLSGWWRAHRLRLGLAIFFLLILRPFTRRQLQKRFLPKPGQGPSRTQIENGCFQMLLVGHAHNKDGRATRMLATVEGMRDPGYGETAKMLAESAMALSIDSKDLPEMAGVLTPASALGSVLVRRLRNAGMTLEVHNWPAGSNTLNQVQKAYRNRVANRNPVSNS